jgi:hypothetical protein
MSERFLLLLGDLELEFENVWFKKREGGVWMN